MRFRLWYICSLQWVTYFTENESYFLLWFKPLPFICYQCLVCIFFLFFSFCVMNFSSCVFFYRSSYHTFYFLKICQLREPISMKWLSSFLARLFEIFVSFELKILSDYLKIIHWQPDVPYLTTQKGYRSSPIGKKSKAFQIQQKIGLIYNLKSEFRVFHWLSFFSCRIYANRNLLHFLMRDIIHEKAVNETY